MTTARSSTRPQLIDDVAQLRQRLASAREAGLNVGLVPTMGALHEGHLSLVDACRRECGLVVVTIFVNPTQFGPHEDFARYPRDLQSDLQLLAAHGADVVFAPQTEAMYRDRHCTYVEMTGPAETLEGDSRPGHFRGVATIVLKLFNLVQPERAYFGRKDFQQSLVVRRMVADLDLPIKIVVCPLVREPDGLAKSSRNVFLSQSERGRALSLSQSLVTARQMVSDGQADVAAIVTAMREKLAAADVEIDYVAICDRDTLRPLEKLDGPAVALVAARVGQTRLIDNELLEGPS
ncbi:MAG: pantoate--beta-alanine ligase [Planctomycetota bacterium]|nr:MAG: pantoate--beta-alanine ligase [Planctomycetota bacterium]